MSEQNQLLTAKQAAEFLRVSIFTLYGWTSAGKIPHRKVGSLLRFDVNELVEWTKSNGQMGIKTA
ncbi:MAG: helix-turn-helix domain-containing protein [Elusimicrobiota bacterium]